jgi:hypothetical protein
MGQVQIQFGNIRGQAVPLPGGAVKRVPPQQGRIDLAARLLKSWTQQIARLTDEKTLKDAPKESIEKLNKQIEEAKQQIDKLQQRLRARAEAGEQKTP